GGLSSRRVPMLTVLAVSELGGLVAIVAVLAVVGPGRPGAGALAWAAAAGAAGSTGLGALYRGMAVGAMGVVAPLSSAAAIVPVAFGVATGERPGTLQVAGVA